MNSPSSRQKNPFRFVKGQTADERLLLILETWRHARPGEYAAYKRHIELVNQSLRRDSGMSDGKLIRYRSEIPADLYVVICRFMPGYLDEPVNMLKLEKLLMGKYLKLPKTSPFINRSCYDEAPSSPAGDIKTTADSDLSLCDRKE